MIAKDVTARDAADGLQRAGAVLAGLGLAVLLGCRAPGEPGRVRFGDRSPTASAWRPSPASPRAVELKLRVVGRSVEGRPITCQVLGSGGDVVLIMATIHGNEPAGTPLVHRLAEHVAAHPELLEGRQVVLVPVANPDGLARDTRHNARGVDLNRNFPASNFSARESSGPRALSEPESRVIDDLLATYRPDRIVSIHQPLNCIDYDGPARALARAMSACCSLPVRKLGGRPGSLGSYAGITKGIPIITVELPKSAGRLSDAALWQRYGEMLLAAICFPERVSGAP